MKAIANRKAVNALLLEYKNVVDALKRVIENLTFSELTTIVDETTTNPDCQSIQSILTHVVSSGYAYCGYIRKLRKEPHTIHEKTKYKATVDYIRALNELVIYTNATFDNISDKAIEAFEEEKKIKTTWGQVYDIEQMMEHAIVHVLRHRRQIEKFKVKLERV